MERLLAYSNVEIYSFFDNYSLITNLDNYKDYVYYSGEINDKILNWIKDKKYKITNSNYEAYLAKKLDFYLDYNYDEIFKNK